MLSKPNLTSLKIVNFKNKGIVYRVTGFCISDSKKELIIASSFSKQGFRDKTFISKPDIFKIEVLVVPR